MSYPKYEIIKDTKGEFRFNFKAKNHEIILSSSEGYKTKADCRNAIGICQRNAPYDVDYDRRTTRHGKHYFTLRSDNGRDIGRSEDYETSRGRDAGIEDVKRDGPTEAVDDKT